MRLERAPWKYRGVHGLELFRSDFRAPGADAGGRITVTSGYGGGSVGTALPASRPFREWRTPPLWGVRDSAPYLHDGRAYTLEGAIVAHGGEAEPSARRFEKLQKKERAQVLAFLQSLAAP